MLNKARKKFIFWAMIAMAVIVMVLIGAVNIVSRYQNSRRLDAAMQEIIDFRTGLRPPEDYQDGIFLLPVDAIVGDEFKTTPDSEETGAEAEDAGESSENEYREGDDAENADAQGKDPEAKDSADTDTQDDEQGSSGGKQQPDDFHEGKKSGGTKRGSAMTQYGSRYFIAIVDRNNQVIRVEQQQDLVTSEYAQELVDALPQDYMNGGFINDYKYSYVDSLFGLNAICFLDCETDMHSLRSLLLISVIIGAVGLLLAFLFILRMSRIAVEPVRISIEKQKQFITNAGHELKTPLTSIATNMDILTMDLGKNEWVDGTKKQVGRLRRLVENLVSLSKMEEEDRILEFQEFSISEVAADCAETFEAIAQMNDMEIETQIAGGLNVQADPGTVQQLVTILCDNAVKYSTGRTIKVRLYEEGKNICFETENEWEQNVEQDRLDDLFERFYRGDPARSSEGRRQGHGLGLSIAKAIAEKNNAKLFAEAKDSSILFKVKFKKP